VGAEPVAIVSEDFARTAWPAGDAIGKRFGFGGQGDQLTIVGVARDALTTGRMDRRRPAIYLAQAQRTSTMDLTILVRRARTAAELGPALRQIVRDLDRDLPVFGVQTLLQYRYERGAESRLGSTLLAIFGTLALLLATVGVYAVMSFAVNQRIREIGVRVALGAAAAAIATMFVRQAVRLAVVGLAVGSVLSLGVAKLLSATFLGLSMSDAIPFGASGVLLAVAVVAASWIPARRAARVDPMVALRAE
jgi:ABC-type lipoprotein release transport system permease subunit